MQEFFTLKLQQEESMKPINKKKYNKIFAQEVAQERDNKVWIFFEVYGKRTNQIELVILGLMQRSMKKMVL